MASIDDFVNHRWADAKAELGKLDEDFISKVESETRLQALGLTTPWLPDVGRRPAQWLPKRWHRLLEECLELTIQTSILQTAAVSLTADVNSEMSRIKVGRRADYHFRSWCIHANTLAVRTDYIIDKTIEVYLAESTAADEIAKRHKERVYKQVTVLVDKRRNEYAHGTTRSMSSGITEDELWEGMVASAMTPIRFLDEFHYLDEGSKVICGNYDFLADTTTTILDRLGSILGELETDMTGSL